MREPDGDRAGAGVPQASAQPGLPALDAAGFHLAAATAPFLACLLHSGLSDAERALAARLQAAVPAWSWSGLDLRQAPEIGRMFGLAGEAPWLLLMREGIGLYRDLLSARPPAAMEGLLARAAALDMAGVQAEVARERQARDTLFARRACPTVWRSPA